MTPKEDELRRALDARSGSPTPEFRARLSRAFDRGRPKANLMPAVALAVVVVLSVTSIGVLMAARNAGRTHGGLASTARVVTPTPIAMPTSAQLVAPSTNVVWVLVDYIGLYRSTDQGVHWELRPMPAEFGVRPWISFIDDHEGWLLAPGSPTTQCQQAQADIWHTTDAGANWQKLTVQGIAEGQCKDHIWFVDPRQGFMSAWDDNHQPTIYITLDAGHTWKGSALPDPPDFKSQPGGFTLHGAWLKRFGSTLYLEAYGSQASTIHDRQYVFRSADGGVTWTWLTKVPSMYIAMVTESRWLLLIWPGQSQETINAGQQWHVFDSDFHTTTPAGGPQIVFGDAQVGYAEGRGSLQRTVDGGAHWVVFHTPGTEQISSPTPTSGKPTPAFSSVVPIHNTVVDGLQCRLPVYVSGVQGSGGFIGFPEGQIAADDSSNVVAPGGGAWFALSYDAVVKRWLPVPSNWVTSDGTAYFFADLRSGNNMLYEVNAQSGASAELGISPLGYRWQVFAVTPDFVFAMSLMSHSGLYLMPISSPYTQEKYITDGFWTAASGDYVFGSAVPEGGAVERLDARNQVMGSPPVGAEPWFNKSNSADILGSDGSGHPVIWTGTELWIATGPNQATIISSKPPLAEPMSQGSPVYGANAPVSDSHGLWFSTTDGIYLYAKGQATKISNLVGQVAGPCI